MKSHPVVSVIMPAYNAADTLLESVSSVLAQSMGELELIVCDDASTDATPVLLAAIDDPRLKFIRNPSNLGAGPSRDRAIEQASAPWVAFIDADDVWLPERLERLLRAVEDAPDRLVFDDIMTCHSVAGKLVPWRRVHGNNAFGGNGPERRDIHIENYVSSPRLIMQPLIPLAFIRQAGLRHSNRSFGEDAEYFLHLALAGVGFRYLPEPLYLYRVQPGSATAKAGAAQMRECIESCAALEGWSNDVQAAFKRKIESLRHNETLYSVAQHLRSGRLLSAMRQLVLDPAALGILPSRLIRHLAYQLHRLRHGGSSRSPGGR
ncbi:glycosyltransferase family 2 protein [Pseudomonas sp. EGD-AK9]|uniref:glycosyltransferase family 2 protein n=1 Tax=Pseudomonas sp. EGD-AK9 TaxID=1386078 RepID=UPI001C436EE6|nr:glycosyltransferase family 2 protein [Pseudomonas sp. EGD-AK9]